MKQNIFQDDREKEQHWEAINRLCQEFPGKEDLVHNCYWEFLAPLITQATIRNYLTILVTRKVRMFLSKNERPKFQIQ
jgi:hypothetical protein